MIIGFARTIFLYLLAIFAIRLMGKKQVGQLEPVEFVIIIMLSELASIPMQDMELPLMSSIVPIATLVSLEILISIITLKSRRIRYMFQGKPIILIDHGQMDIDALKKTRYNIDEIMEELRQCGYADIRDVEYAILENSGRISVIPSARSKPVTTADMQIKSKPGAMPYIVISDGEIVGESLKILKITVAQLQDRLIQSKIPNASKVFYAVLDTEGEFYFQLKKGGNKN